MSAASPTRLRLAAIAAALALALVAAGCDSTGDESADTTNEGAASAPADAGQPLTPAEENGRDLFVENCGSCHTLDAAGSDGSVGPNLDEVQLSKDEILATIEEGPGAMPSNAVSGQEAQDVAAFVDASGP